MNQCTIFLLLFCGVLISGCSGGPPPAPVTPDQPINAALPDHLAIYGGTLDNARLPNHDTLVVARFRLSTKYATTRKSTNWNYHWLLITYDVVKVEKGNWPFKTVRFIVQYTWPTPESGIKLKCAHFPYGKRVGAVLAFALDTSTSPAKIVAQQKRVE